MVVGTKLYILKYLTLEYSQNILSNHSQQIKLIVRKKNNKNVKLNT